MGRRRAPIATVVFAALVVGVVGLGLALRWGQGGGGATLSRSPLVGRPAPPLAGVTVGGGHASLASYRGRWVFVNFFASWCVPCQKETPELARFAAAHPGPRDPAILGVVYQDDDNSVRDFTRHHGVTWPLISYAGTASPDAYGVAGIPVTFLVAPDGKVAQSIVGGLGSGQLNRFLAQADRSALAPAASLKARS